MDFFNSHISVLKAMALLNFKRVSLRMLTLIHEGRYPMMQKLFETALGIQPHGLHAFEL